MNNEKLVSVVIAAYNASKFIEEAIESVLAQEYKNFEILLVDDGSNDNTKEKVEKYLNDSRLNYFYQKNQGQAKAKNKGIIESKGELIAFLDADDKWTPNKLKLQIPCFETSEKIGVVFTDMAWIAEDGAILKGPKRKLYSGNLTSKLLIENVVSGMSSVVRRECFRDVGLFDETLPMGIDYDLWLRISTKYEFYSLNQVTYLYRQWPGQMSHKHRERYENGIQIMKKFLNNHPDLLDDKIVNEAWAHTFVGKGNVIFKKEKRKIEAFQEYLKALRYKIDYLPAWKSIAKLIINKY